MCSQILQPCIGAPQKPSEFSLPDLDCLADKIAAIEFPAGQTRSDALALDQPAIARKIEDRKAAFTVRYGTCRRFSFPAPEVGIVVQDHV
jgi:hypothetical protein